MADGLGIPAVGSGATIPSIVKPLAVELQPAESFQDVLFAKIDQVNTLQREADAAVAELAAGRAKNVAEVMAAVQKAEIAFQTLLAIRNKLMEAYDEISQMRI